MPRRLPGPITTPHSRGAPPVVQRQRNAQQQVEHVALAVPEVPVGGSRGRRLTAMRGRAYMYVSRAVGCERLYCLIPI